ncbi:MAG: hypothetical protein QOF60_594 [Actinomycetota bacterium]|nr:hypothetical protein [Actinomycetota bacterium]
MRGRVQEPSSVLRHTTEPLVVTMDHLDVPRVLDAIEAAPRVVLSRTGNFAAHGVNLLRTHVRRAARPITVAVGLPALPEAGSEVLISPEGIVTGTFPRVPDQIGRSSVDRPHVALDVETSVLEARCYWPDRRYDPFTASLMLPGLTADAARLAGGAMVDGWRAPSGHLWFDSGAPSSMQLLSLALDPEIAGARIDEQAALYSAIFLRITELREAHVPPADAFTTLVELVRAYFSTFLLFHNDYDVVLRAWTDPADFDDTLQSSLTSWMLETKQRLPITKSLWESGPPLDMPPFGIDDDLAHAAAAPAPPRQRLAARAFVLKEWKFFVNKLLFREFAATCRSLHDEEGLRRLAQRPLEQRG